VAIFSSCYFVILAVPKHFVIFFSHIADLAMMFILLTYPLCPLPWQGRGFLEEGLCPSG